MGAADIVPGVSGGTIAFITGIYLRLLNALKSFTPNQLIRVFKGDIQGVWRDVDGTFLACLFAGIITSIILLSHTINYLLVHHAILLWSFFFGLVAASAVYVGRQVTSWRFKHWFFLFSGMLMALLILQLKPAELPDTWWMVMLAGSVAICAMILPGLSGSFILMMMGMYETIIAALVGTNVPLLASFVVGCILGLLMFSHLLSWLMRHYFNAIMAILVGFLVGSLKAIWPWKITITEFVNRHGESKPLVQEVVWPHQYELLTGGPSLWLPAIGCALFGLSVVFALEIWANSNKK